MLKTFIKLSLILPSLFLISCGSLSYTERLKSKEQKNKLNTTMPTQSEEKSTLPTTLDAPKKPVQNELILPDLALDSGGLISL